MSKILKIRAKSAKKPKTLGSYEAVEQAIDASKSTKNPTWEPRCGTTSGSKLPKAGRTPIKGG